MDMENGYSKGNYYWRDPFLTSMIMGGSVYLGPFLIGGSEILSHAVFWCTTPENERLEPEKMPTWKRKNMGPNPNHEFFGFQPLVFGGCRPKKCQPFEK